MNQDAYIAILAKMHEDGIDSRALALIDVKDGLRSFGFACLKGIAAGIDGLYTGLYKICGALSFSYSPAIQKLVNTYSSLLYSLLILAFVGVGFYFILKKNNTQLNFVQNIFICVLICAALPTFTAKMSTLTSGAVHGVMKNGYTSSTIKGNYKMPSGNAVNGKWNVSRGSNGSASSVTSIIVANNIVDLQAVDKNLKNSKNSNAPWRSSAKNHKAMGYIAAGTILNGNWKKIDIDQVMDYDDDDFQNEDLWNHKLKSPELGKDSEWTSINKKIFNKFQTCYYRWQILSWFNMFAMFFIMLAVLLLALIKCARIVFEVAQANIYMPFIAASDLAVGQRTKEGLKNFISLFAAMFLCIALLGVYFVGFSWIESKNWSAFVRIVAQLALAWATIDGPNVIERIIGVDVGLKSGWSMVMGVKAAGTAAKGTVGAVAAPIKAGHKAGSGISDLVFGKRAPNNTFSDGKRHGGLRGMKRGEGFRGNVDPNAEDKTGKKKEGQNKDKKGGEGSKGTEKNKESFIGNNNKDSNINDATSVTGDKVENSESASSYLDSEGINRFKDNSNLGSSDQGGINDNASEFGKFKNEVKNERNDDK